MTISYYVNSSPCTAVIKCLGALFCAVLIQTADAQTVRLHGGVGIAKSLTAKKAAIESKAGVTVEIVGNGTGRGLSDLSGGQADIALVAGSLKDAAQVINKEKPGSVDVTGMKEFPLKTVKNAFITHPGVGVKSLTEAQLRDVLSGKVANWSEVGGANVPIKLVLPAEGDGTRTTFQTTVLQGAPFAKNAIIRTSAKDLTIVVQQLPGTCSIVSAINVEGSVTSVSLEKEVPMAWLLVVKGEPAGDVKKVLEAATVSID